MKNTGLGARLVAAGLACSCGVACGSTSSHETAEAVWSDDDGGWAIVHEWFEAEGRPFDDATTRTDYEHELMVRDVAGDASEVLLPRRDGAAGPVFYMRSAGYVLLRVDGRHQRVGLDGEMRELPDRGAYLPSPDGSVLASYELADCDPSDSSGVLEDCSVSIELWDASSLVRLEGWEVAMQVRSDLGIGAIWGPEGTLFVGGFETLVGVSSGEPPRVDVEPPRCFDPATTSSALAADGTRVTATLRDGTVELQTEPDGAGWPERCLPSR